MTEPPLYTKTIKINNKYYSIKFDLVMWIHSLVTLFYYYLIGKGIYYVITWLAPYL